VEAAIKTIDAEIIVVDNNSKDDSCNMVKALFPEVKLIENTDNLGFSKGNNIGVKRAEGEYICILNPDTVVPEDCFIKLLDFADSQSKLGIVGCQLIDGKAQFLPESKRNIPTPVVALKKLLGKDSGYYANKLDNDDIGACDILVGALMVIPKTVYDKVAGFDEDYFMYGEDVDLSYKCLKNGFTNYYYGKTIVIHFKGESTLKDANYAKRFYGAMQIFYKKHFKGNILFNGLVWLGLKLAYMFRKSSRPTEEFYEQTYVFTGELKKALREILVKPVHVHSQLNTPIEDNSLVIYDLSKFQIKTVIADMIEKKQKFRIRFRFLPRNSTFILGSDSSVSRGEVLQF
jgi:GT2 family glycosyltransferase